MYVQAVWSEHHPAEFQQVTDATLRLTKLHAAILYVNSITKILKAAEKHLLRIKEVLGALKRGRNGYQAEK